jgi:hypothetical protein
MTEVPQPPKGAERAVARQILHVRTEASGISEDVKKLGKMVEVTTSGDWEKGMTTGGEIGKDRMKKKADRAVSSIKKETENMGYTTATDVNGKKDHTTGSDNEKTNYETANNAVQTIESVLKGDFSDPAMMKDITATVESIVSQRSMLAAEWKTLRPAEKKAAVQAMLSQPGMRAKIIQELEAAQGLKPSQNVENLTQQNTENDKVIKSIEEGDATKRPPVDKLEDRENNLQTKKTAFENDYPTNEDDISGTKEGDIRRLGDEAETRKVNYNNIQTEITALRNTLDGRNQAKTILQANGVTGKRIDAIDAEIKQLNFSIAEKIKNQNDVLDQDKQYRKLLREKQTRQTEIDNISSTLNKDKATLEAAKNTKDSLAKQIATAKADRDNQEEAFATSLEGVVENALDGYLDQEAQRAIADWKAELPKYQEQKTEEEAKDAIGKAKEKENQNQMVDAALGKILRDEYITLDKDWKWRPHTDKRSGKKILWFRLGRAHLGEDRQVETFNVKKISEVYDTMVDEDPTNFQTKSNEYLKSSLDKLVADNKLTQDQADALIKDQETIDRSQAFIAKETIKARVKNDPGSAPTEVEKGIMAEHPWFDKIVEQGLVSEKSQTALETVDPNVPGDEAPTKEDIDKAKKGDKNALAKIKRIMLNSRGKFALILGIPLLLMATSVISGIGAEGQK